MADVLKRFFKGTGAVYRYVRKRIFQRSTAVAFFAGVPGVAMLPQPWATLALFGCLVLAIWDENGPAKVEGE